MQNHWSKEKTAELEYVSSLQVKSTENASGFATLGSVTPDMMKQKGYHGPETRTRQMNAKRAKQPCLKTLHQHSNLFLKQSPQQRPLNRRQRISIKSSMHHTHISRSRISRHTPLVLLVPSLRSSSPRIMSQKTGTDSFTCDLLVES